MPAQLGEIVTFQAQWSILGVPTGSLSPTPTITIYAPDGSVLVNAASMTALGASTWYGYTYTLPGTPAGEYKAQPYCSQSGLDVAYLPPIVLAVGQAWIQDLDAAVSSRATPAQVHTQMVSALAVDTYSEPSAPPAAAASLAEKLGWIQVMARNKLTQTSTLQTVYADDTTTPIATASVSDDGTTATRNEMS